MKEKIYITSLHMKHGGVEMAIAMLSNALVKRGYDVEILNIYKLGKPAYELDSRVKVTYLTDVHPNREEFSKARAEHAYFKMIKEGLYALKVLYLKKKSIQDAVKKIDSGVIISSRIEHSVLLSKYGKKNVLKIAQLHHDHEFNEKYLEDFRKHFTNIDKFVLLTDGIQKEIEEILKGYNEKTECVTIPHFLECVKQDVDIHKKEKTVVTVGRLHPVKGFDRLIEAWKMVAARENGWKLKIIGGGDLEKSLQEKIEELGLADSVELTGAMKHEDVMEEMKKASIYALSSHSEAFAIVLIEAMSNALPAVAFDVRVGPGALIEDGKEGYLVEDGDLEAFSTRLCELMEDSEKRMRMSEHAMKKAEEFSEEEIMKQWTALIDRK